MCTEQSREAVSSTVSADIKVAEELDKSAAAAARPNRVTTTQSYEIALLQLDATT